MRDLIDNQRQYTHWSVSSFSVSLCWTVCSNTSTKMNTIVLQEFYELGSQNSHFFNLSISHIKLFVGLWSLHFHLNVRIVLSSSSRNLLRFCCPWHVESKWVKTIFLWYWVLSMICSEKQNQPNFTSLFFSVVSILISSFLKIFSFVYFGYGFHYRSLILYLLSFAI